MKLTYLAAHAASFIALALKLPILCHFYYTRVYLCNLLEPRSKEAHFMRT